MQRLILWAYFVFSEASLVLANSSTPGFSATIQNYHNAHQNCSICFQSETLKYGQIFNVSLFERSSPSGEKLILRTEVHIGELIYLGPLKSCSDQVLARRTLRIYVDTLDEDCVRSLREVFTFALSKVIHYQQGKRTILIANSTVSPSTLKIHTICDYKHQQRKDVIHTTESGLRSSLKLYTSTSEGDSNLSSGFKRHSTRIKSKSTRRQSIFASIGPITKFASSTYATETELQTSGHSTTTKLDTLYTDKRFDSSKFDFLTRSRPRTSQVDWRSPSTSDTIKVISARTDTPEKKERTHDNYQTSSKSIQTDAITLPTTDQSLNSQQPNLPNNNNTYKSGNDELIKHGDFWILVIYLTLVGFIILFSFLNLVSCLRLKVLKRRKAKKSGEDSN